jgi:hypothetical protein
MPIVSVNIPSGAYSRIPKAIAGYNLTADNPVGSGGYFAIMLTQAINGHAADWRANRMNDAYEAMRGLSDNQFNNLASGLGIGLV